MKTLVVFFSRSGTTKKVAHGLQNTLKGDAEEIREPRGRGGIWGYIRSGIEAVKKKLNAAFDSDVLSKVRCCLLADFIHGKIG